jgi:competence ComEA-like helix-hairpin-helix protein
MNIVSRFESKFGFTRADVTVALFVAGTALLGFIYTTLFETRSSPTIRRDLLALERRQDSIVEARRVRQLGLLERTLADPDSAEQWQPLTRDDSLDDARRDSAAKPSGSGGGKKLPSSPVDLNTASKEELMKLPGVGEKTAMAIVEARRRHPFRRPEDIMEVKGIGRKKFENMRPYIIVTGK